MDPFATVADYQELTAQNLSGTQAAQVAALLAETSALMRGNAADLDARLTAGTLARVLVVGVCVRAVFRYLANPDHASSRTTGPFSRAYAVANTRGLWLTRDEIDSLTPTPEPGTGHGVGTIRMRLTVGTARANQGPRW